VQNSYTPPKASVPEAPDPSGLKSLQWRIILLTYFSYFFYYFGRKYFGFITPDLISEGVLTKNQIGFIQTGYLSLYAVGQFVSGALGDKKGARMLISIGMITSGVAALVIGIFPVFFIVLLAWTINGLAQSTGWSNNCKLISNWIPHDTRGRVMGFWMTCYILGSLLANTLAGYLIDAYSWQLTVIVNGAIVLIIGIIQGIYLINRPEDRGHSFPRRESACEETGGVASFKKIIMNPVILMYGGAYFSLKFIRYTVFSWFPLYLVEAKGFSSGEAAYASNGFEIGGIVGLLIGGYFADKFFNKNKGRLAWITLIGVCVTSFFFSDLSKGGFWMVVLALALVGFFLYIADSLLSGSAAQDVGGAENSAAATGIVNGIGSIGGALAGITPIWVQQHYGWDGVFTLFTILSVVASAILIPVALKKEVKKA